MTKALILGFLVLFLVSNPGNDAIAQMQSEHYRIPTSVMSGGGGPMNSGSGTYQLNGTMGQPSPLMDAADPPYSLSYDLYPGFWYALGAGCLWDTEPAEMKPPSDANLCCRHVYVIRLVCVAG